MSTATTARDLTVTVIIPTCNDAHLLTQTISAVKAAGPAQVLVIDGGSSDGSVMLARHMGVKVIKARCERGRQLRLGVASASGDVLVVVPPGVVLRRDALQRVRTAVEDPRVLAGVIESDHENGRWIAPVLNGLYGGLRTFGLTPMNSAIFVWRTACHNENCFRSLKVFAELDLLRRLARRGRVVRLADAAEMIVSHELHRLVWTLLELPYRLRMPARVLGWAYRKPEGREEAMPATEVLIQARRSSDLTMST